MYVMYKKFDLFVVGVVVKMYIFVVVFVFDEYFELRL